MLAVIYLIFNEGYAATAGDTLIRRQLCVEAIRLGRRLAHFMPDEPAACQLRRDPAVTRQPADAPP